jgi:uncharacterized membrane protein YtjA (UPF0391 family)
MIANVLGEHSPNTGSRGFLELSLAFILAEDVIQTWRQTMLYWALVFLVVALIAGVLGFAGVAVAAAGIAKILFFVFLVLFVISLVAHLGSGSRSLN